LAAMQVVALVQVREGLGDSPTKGILSANSLRGGVDWVQ